MMKRTLYNLASLWTLYPRRIFFIILFALPCALNQASASSLKQEQAFSKHTISQLQQQFNGQRWLMILWSIDCPPCFKELAHVQNLLQEHQDLAIVIVNADDDGDIMEQRQKVIDKFQLARLANFYFVEDQGAKNRYLIDPQWYGELPRSYFIDENGKFNGKSGLIKPQHIRQWLSLPK